MPETSERDILLQKLKLAVHSELDYDKYNSTAVNNSTNCFSHAIGSTLSNIQLHRVGAISGLKPIDQGYFSIPEICTLLEKDISTLELGFDKSFIGDLLAPNQYQIALFIKIYADGKIHDYHFYRNDNRGWSEKWRYRKPRFMESFTPLTYFPWNYVGIYKITK